MNFYEILMKWAKIHKTLKYSALYYFSFICLALIFIYKGYYNTNHSITVLGQLLTAK